VIQDAICKKDKNMTDIVEQPLKFLGATVLSFNCALGLGSQESTLSLELVEDCQSDPPDEFTPKTGSVIVGDGVYFSASADEGAFNFNGVLTSWNETQGASGRTISAKVSDPRQLLENTIVIVDSYLGPPIQTTNYFNVYSAYEGTVLEGDCEAFGTAQSSERGMPYIKIIEMLTQLNPNICSPTGYIFTVDFASFPQGVPEYYRVPGPAITLLQLLQDVCNVLGFEFYVTLDPEDIINIGLIDLKNPPAGFDQIVKDFDGIATELSYGQELRNEKTKAVIFGEKQHYFSPASTFGFFFGEEWDGNNFIPVIPYKFDACYGFWIKKRVKELNGMLNKPLPGGNGPYSISEADIRAAMASFDAWLDRICIAEIAGGLNSEVRNNFNLNDSRIKGIWGNIQGDTTIDPQVKYKALCDAFHGPNPNDANGKPQEILDLEAIHGFVQNLGTTYYGKQFFTQLDQRICAHRGGNFQEIIFTDEPTNAGAWVDYDIPVLGLEDPDLGLFRETDDRISGFAVFAVDDGDVEKPDEPIGQSEPPDSYASAGETGGGSGGEDD
jgi:hypothetical protein